jgi:hypothetical protein
MGFSPGPAKNYVKLRKRNVWVWKIEISLYDVNEAEPNIEWIKDITIYISVIKKSISNLS